MNKEELENTKDFYINDLQKERNEEINEETIKILVVKDVLHALGYKKEWFRCEKANMLGRSDIRIAPPNSDILYVETKPKDHKITNYQLIWTLLIQNGE